MDVTTGTSSAENQSEENLDMMKNMFEDFYKVMEIYFDKQIIFPYMFLNDIQEVYDGEYDEANIYMLMLCDKLEIVEVVVEKLYILVIYKNVADGNKKEIKLYYNTFLGIDISKEYVKTSVEKFGIILKVEIEENAFTCLKNMMGMPSAISNVFRLNIYDLISICERKKITYDDYRVLYIGQSNPRSEYRTIFDRLRKHEKVTSIFSDYNLEYRDKELIVFILHAKSKLYNFASLVCLGSSKWQEYDSVGDKIDDTAIIDVAEAMLIYHLKPQYNIKLKDSIPNINMKIYNQLISAGLKRIEIGINLYMQTYKKRINLLTEEQKIKTGFRILKCDLTELFQKKQEAEIVYEDLPDYMYDIIQG